MTSRRFKQIRSAFHLKPDFALYWDKCHQLRYIINKFNDTEMHTFIPSIDMSFDEGDIPSRSRMNPVWQYNKVKPNKYRVDCFVLANNSKKKYFVQHIDVSWISNNSEGKSFILSYWCEYSIWNIHTNALTMSCVKAVFNAVMQSGISNDPNGLQWLNRDNHYSARTLLVILCEVHGILASSTVHVNRVV